MTFRVSPSLALQPALVPPPAAAPSAAEREFYGSYPWCLNPFLAVGDTVARLREELARLTDAVDAEPWQRDERMLNVCLLGCTLLNAVDDDWHGPAFHLPRRAARLPLARPALHAAAALTSLWRLPRAASLRRWRQGWQPGFDSFLRAFVADRAPSRAAIAALAEALGATLPPRFAAQLIRLPSAFRKQDLTHFDAIALSEKFAGQFPDRTQPIVIVGLRTAGSYFAPLLRADLENRGYRDIDLATLRPGKGVAAHERAHLVRAAKAGRRAVVIDDPPFSGDTLGIAAEALRRAGFAAGALVLLFPVNPLRRDWRTHKEAAAFSGETVITLEPADWHKERLLAPEAAARRIAEYYHAQGWRRAEIVDNPAAVAFNAELEHVSGDARRLRLKRVYAVRLEGEGGVETRFVLAKSVGWGWFGYAAFITGDRLAGLVPPLIGLRDGLLHSEWLPQTRTVNVGGVPRAAWIDAAADYTAARARALALPASALPTLGRDAQHEGFEILGGALAKAYGGGAAADLMHGRLRRRLAALPSPMSALIDGKMARAEWIAGHGGLLKIDYEQHGFGKNELNVADPAYDLADAALQLGLSAEEQQALLRRYAQGSGDGAAGQRLMLWKLLAGLWSMQTALDALAKQPHLAHRAAEFNAQYLRAWDFLTVETARFCGARYALPAAPAWRARLAVLDVDGVIDRRIFGFPAPTAAAIEALALLHAHGVAVAIDTARSAREVREYCAAYGLSGGVAECGAYAWDAVAQRERMLIADADRAQLARLRDALRTIPGVFLNDGYDYSIRAFTYGRRGTVPLPDLMVRNLIAGLGLDRLACYDTNIDTTVAAKNADKGSGLVALLDLAGQRGVETVAVGDSETDLPMFRAATRSFAPAHIDCGRIARALGCTIAAEPFQRGFRAIVRALVHPDGGHCPRCVSEPVRCGLHDALILDLLAAADANPRRHLARALFDAQALRVFVR